VQVGRAKKRRVLRIPAQVESSEFIAGIGYVKSKNMKKEEFPTFLNEQPTVVFGRTSRELLILTIGIACGYLLWLDITGPSTLGSIGLILLKVICITLVAALALIVAFVKVATRPLEEWAIIGFSYLVIPKVYLYLPQEDGERPLKEEIEGEELLHAPMLTEDDDDRYS
jgi:hypothetical protein